MKDRSKRYAALAVAVLVMGLIVGFAAVDKARAQSCNGNTVTANVIALDQNFFINRLGALNNLGMIYALEEDVFPIDQNGVIGDFPCSQAACSFGQVVLRPDKRPQPIALRVSRGQCLTIAFRNLLRDTPIDPAEQNVTRAASAHVTGLPLVGGIGSDGSWVGANATSLVQPGGSTTYTYFAQDENVYMITNMANTTGSQGAGGSLTFGLYGVVIVEPAGTEYYRGHVTNEDMALAACQSTVRDVTTGNPAADCLVKTNQNRTADDHPKIDYDARYPSVLPFTKEGKAGRYILKMVDAGRLVHSDIHAVITGPNRGPLTVDASNPNTATNPRRDRAFREAASVFGDEHFNVQAFPLFFNDPVLHHTLNITKDGFVINYGGGAIGPEIIANRLGVGPMWDCPECKAEEFFLTSWAVGDPGMWVDVPANGCIQNAKPPVINGISANPFVTPINFQTPPPGTDPNLNISCENGGGVPTQGPKASVALYPDNPSNVHHSYIHDHFKFRNIHAGPFEHHIFHLHGNQWVFQPRSDNANYMDMQQIGPGSSYTMDITNEGTGNRNYSPGDAIYHCHFYPHFAQGMWSALRMLDTFAEGTELKPRLTDPTLPSGPDNPRAVWAQRDAPPAPGSRAYPDGEVGQLDEATTPVCATPVTTGAGTFIAFPAETVPVCPDICFESATGAFTFPVPANGCTGNQVQTASTIQTNVDINGDKQIALACVVGLCNGSPVPAVVPLPDYPMAPMPQPSTIDTADARRVKVDQLATVPGNGNPFKNPGFPFYVAGVGGHRPPSPPMDIAIDPATGPIDGGLPRHVITGGETEFVVNRYDINKELINVEAELVPENGTDVEIASFNYHSVRCHNTYKQTGVTEGGNGQAVAATCEGSNTLGKKFYGGFITNGLPSKQGAPHADPCVDNLGNPITANSTTVWNSPTCTPAVNGCDPGLAFKLTKDGQFDNATPRPYKIANIQIDLVLNKKGWHFPQQRIISLWGDVAQQYAGTLPPHPMVFRLNTLDCAEVWHANLVPNYYELDDFQVRTPTDIIAQHSHMTKFDMASSDGAANLWNYEDGTMSPGEIVERIDAINRNGGLIVPVTTQEPNGRRLLTAKTHPYFEGQTLPYKEITVGGVNGAGTCFGKTCGARTTIQRWLADPVLNKDGVDRGIGNVFTHDHFGPSTFQQLGLYATILAEPRGSTWKHNETGVVFPDAGRLTNQNPLLNDGGPTSWQAQIIPLGDGKTFNDKPYREFYFENSDFQQAYKRQFNGVLSQTSFLDAIARPSRDGNPLDIYVFDQLCPGLVPSPCPMAIGGADQGTEVVNYRSEPVGARIFDPVTMNQAVGNAGDLSFAFASIPRADVALNSVMQAYVRKTEQCPSCTVKPGQGTCGIVGAPAAGDPLFDFQCTGGITSGLKIPTPAGIGNEITPIDVGLNPFTGLPYAVLTADVGPRDPATPMMRVYEGDSVKIRCQVGATEESHHFSVHGAKWLMNYADPNSGWRNFQSMGISENFQFDFPVLGDLLAPGAQNKVDYLYASNMSNSGLFNGEWGLFRSYGVLRPNLARLPNSIVINNRPIQVANRAQLAGAGLCPANAPVKRFDVTAIMARDVLPQPKDAAGNALVVNPLGNSTLDGLPGGTLIYNSRNTPGTSPSPAGGEVAVRGPLHDPAAILYVNTADIAGLRAGGITPEPLILRANAGDCINVTLRNSLPLPAAGAVGNGVPDLNGITLAYEPIIDKCPVVNGVENCPIPKPSFNSNDIFPSSNVGLHAQLVAYNGFQHDGANVGQNVLNPAGNVAAGQVQTLAPGQTKTYIWYAGDFVVQPLAPQGAGANQVARVNLLRRDIEFGVVGLSPSDKLEQASRGLMGAVVIEPKGVVCTPDRQNPQKTVKTTMQADCKVGNTLQYREFVALTQNNVKMYYATTDQTPGFGFVSVPGFPAENPAVGIPDDAEDSGMKAVNYKTEPYWFRLTRDDTNFMNPTTPLNGLAGVDGATVDGQQKFPTEALYANANPLVNGDPQTPIFTAAPGGQFRFYFVEPAGNQRSDVPVIHGHPWQRIPYKAGVDNTLPVGFRDVQSQTIALNPQSHTVGSQEGYGPAGHWNFLPVVPAGGGVNGGVTGDYLYRMQNPQSGFQGSWGLFRVQ